MLNLTRTTLLSASLLAIAVASYTACSGGGSSQGSSTEAVTNATDSGATDGGDASTTPATLPAPSLAVCSDGQIAAILHESDVGEVAVAQSVVGRLVDANAKAFAQRMIDDHTLSDRTLTGTLQTAGVTTVENGLSQEISESAQDEIQKLAQKSGNELDVAYMRDEVLDHLHDLGVGEHLLAPSAKNPAIVMAVQSDHDLIATHAQLASDVETSLEGACGGPKNGSSDGGMSDGGASTDGGSATDGGTGTGTGGTGTGTGTDGGKGGTI